MDDNQRDAMFRAWKEKEDLKQSQCKHRWSYAEPIHCLDCGITREKYERLQMD